MTQDRHDRPTLDARAAALTLVPLIAADEALAMQLLDIRNEPAVRANMYRDTAIAPEEHRAWVAATRAGGAREVWILTEDGAAQGALIFSGIDRVHDRADWAFYLSGRMQGRGLGRALEFRALDMAFGPMGLHRLACQVIAWNTPVIALHESMGFSREGLFREHVRRDDAWHDVIALACLAPDWRTLRPTLAQRS
ncbi:UDP-4-amino-4,6-dideoxy-N-acetyl-beta-L-altrosamine N-acetyltransferase [Mesobaculum littorinae]|uniref:UDP-4-amino-4, 6-dideoxy-N-acetyl-beta-L-altrosamine N-acetyltransferase n=1 Tax=Mesobaculum littorinae TaxID=2486419 RepID=A0A438AK10_9RHOB|nr:UDP-4-amino-4,6-dideoxy-N-acetyl-beta-L-altrosamine N-acetyltransferase [Mesobaculum littorinae]RVV98976.1 UDP-4-amino-4,6-dideoxy-N-acetyl-beta-L-altrosamine N-acetyltransferase [Mesobaculum littorinae]